VTAIRTPGNWVRIHDQIWQDERVLDLAMRGDKGISAVAVFVMGIAWTRHKRLDGRIPAGALPMIHGRKHHAEMLVAAGLWQPEGGGGWTIPKYTTWNETGDQIEAAKAAKVAAGRKSACRRNHSQPCSRPDCAPSNVLRLEAKNAAK